MLGFLRRCFFRRRQISIWNWSQFCVKSQHYFNSWMGNFIGVLDNKKNIRWKKLYGIPCRRVRFFFFINTQLQKITAESLLRWYQQHSMGELFVVLFCIVCGFPRLCDEMAQNWRRSSSHFKLRQHSTDRGAMTVQEQGPGLKKENINLKKRPA
jgi:hypothetical protein